MIFDRYIFRDLTIATAFVAMILASIIMLTESLKFLELIVHSGASAMAFVSLTVLALPRFFEIILPIAAMAGTLFVYNRMTMDSELIVMRATGFSPLRLARPGFATAGCLTLLLFWITLQLTPASLSHMEALRAEIKSQFSSLLFREGVFNPMGKGLTVYIRARAADGELHGLMIHDGRPQNHEPVTVVARRGALVMDGDNQQIVVFDGTRQQVDPKSGALSQLDFDRYTIDLPDNNDTARNRLRQPEERDWHELTHPLPEDIKDRKMRRAYRVEIQRRLAAPFLALDMTVIALVLLLAGPVDRRGQGKRIAVAVAAAVLIESAYLTGLNMARNAGGGIAIMYAAIFLPMALAIAGLTPQGERLAAWWRGDRGDATDETLPDEETTA